jgi:hypothetical protein
MRETFTPGWATHEKHPVASRLLSVTYNSSTLHEKSPEPRRAERFFIDLGGGKIPRRGGSQHFSLGKLYLPFQRHPKNIRRSRTTHAP